MQSSLTRNSNVNTTFLDKNICFSLTCNTCKSHINGAPTLESPFWDKLGCHVWRHLMFMLLLTLESLTTIGFHWVESFPLYGDQKMSPKPPSTSWRVVNGWNFHFRWTAPLTWTEPFLFCFILTPRSNFFSLSYLVPDHRQSQIHAHGQKTAPTCSHGYFFKSGFSFFFYVYGFQSLRDKVTCLAS